ncbi:hypothetical protein EDD99_8143 [Streptomyces sp. 846.5]|nr:hypothetical protein [Streptomyces sp. 846.5]TDT93334.1 hypothetical protein EDD99_8143 [Streptomyces sp. 846.5]
MLTMERPAAEAAVSGTFSYWCEWVGTDPVTGAVFFLGAESELNPRLAMRWAYARGQAIAPQLTPPASWVIGGWLQDDRERLKAVHQLTDGVEYVLTVREESAKYMLTIRPIPSVPLVADAEHGGDGSW